MKIDKIGEKIYEEHKTQELDRQESLTRVMKPNPIRNPFELEKINNELLIENQILTVKLGGINKLLNDLYEAIDEYYTETLESNDELAIACADTQLQLIKEIIEKVEKI